MIAAAAVLVLLSAGPAAPHAADGETRCANCHSVKSWTEVIFPHERTGFPLKGAHQKISCKACHAVDFKAGVPSTCAGCHRDAHASEFGTRCESCHQEPSWRATFSIEDHRQTAFPLTGRHATLPCESCHATQKDRKFGRATVDCAACHLNDFQRTAFVGINHTAFGFTQDCKVCHDTWRFAGARYPDHDFCFQTTGGRHAALRCLSCHTSLPAASPARTCNTGTAACTRCHTHAQPQTDAIHVPVVPFGYQYKDAKCYSCHRFK